LIPPSVPSQLGHLEGLEVDPMSVEGEEASVFIAQNWSIRAVYDLFYPDRPLPLVDHAGLVPRVVVLRSLDHDSHLHGEGEE
jgi:hypothetical protein